MEADEKLLLQGLQVGQQNQWLLASDAQQPRGSARVDSLLVPIDNRSKLPLTKAKYVIKENDELVAWEREVRKFLRRLSPSHEHRVSATMVLEWATGRTTKELMDAEVPVNPHLRNLNKILSNYFGKPYSTWIAGRKVPKAYKVPLGYYITRHRPMTLTLWVEYREGTLEA